MFGNICPLCTKLFKVPDSSPLFACPPAPHICSVVFMVPGLAQHTVSSTDFAKSKIPFRDLFYLKSIPLMGLMAFQSLSMHCQWGRIDFLRIPVLGGKQTALPSHCNLANEQMMQDSSILGSQAFLRRACLWASGLTSTALNKTGSFLSALPFSFGVVTCGAVGTPCIWTLDEVDCCSHNRPTPGFSLGKNQTITLRLSQILGSMGRDGKEWLPFHCPPRPKQSF